MSNGFDLWKTIVNKKESKDIDTKDVKQKTKYSNKLLIKNKPNHFKFIFFIILWQFAIIGVISTIIVSTVVIDNNIDNISVQESKPVKINNVADLHNEFRRLDSLQSSPCVYINEAQKFLKNVQASRDANPYDASLNAEARWYQHIVGEILYGKYTECRMLQTMNDINNGRYNRY